MSDTTHYTLSQNYELMFVLLENGPLLGFVDYEQGSTLRDPVQIKRVADGKYFEYRAGVRGFGYINAFSKDAKDKFVEQCRKYNLSFIVPNADAEARAERAIKENRILTSALLKTGCLVIPHGSFFLEDVPKIIGRTLKEAKEENEHLRNSKAEAIETAEAAHADSERLRANLEPAYFVTVRNNTLVCRRCGNSHFHPSQRKRGDHVCNNCGALLFKEEIDLMMHADEAARVTTPCPICGQHGHIGDCEGD